MKNTDDLNTTLQEYFGDFETEQEGTTKESRYIIAKWLGMKFYIEEFFDNEQDKETYVLTLVTKNNKFYSFGDNVLTNLLINVLYFRSTLISKNEK